MGSITLLQLEQNVWNLLNETFDSPAGDLRAGAAGGATIAGITPSSSSAVSTMKTLLNEAAADLARSCFPVPDTGTLSWSSGVRTQSIASFTPATANEVFWAVRGVSFGGLSVGLKWCERAALERSDPNWMVTSNAAPSYWYNDGPFNIALYPKPSTTGTVTIDGFVIPVPFVAASDAAAWLPDDLSHLLVWYAADMIARKNMEDQALSARSDDWREWRFLYDTARQDLWSKIPASLRYLFPTPPVTARPTPPMMGPGPGAALSMGMPGQS